MAARKESGAYELSFYDVPDRRVTRAGATLSRRLAKGKGIWQLEFEQPDGSHARLEQPGGPSSPPSRIARALPALLRSQDPERVLRVSVHRDGSRETVEVLEGPYPSEQLEPAGVRAFVLGVLGCDEPAPTEPIGRLRAMLARQYEEILRHDLGVRLDLDAESVHRFRVATRRARAVLRAARPVLDREWSEPLRTELKWLGSSLGPRRDLDVLVTHLDTEIARLEQPEQKAAETLVKSLEHEREAAQVLAVEALSSERYFRLLDELEAAARGAKVRRSEVALSKLAAREFKRLRKAARRLGPDATDGELHEARILGKRARYAAELAGPELGKGGARLLKRAKTFQDVLGAHQDAIVAEGRLRGLLGDAPGTGAAFAAGRLVERQRLRRREARAKVPKAWRALERSAEAALG